MMAVCLARGYMLKMKRSTQRKSISQTSAFSLDCRDPLFVLQVETPGSGECGYQISGSNLIGKFLMKAFDDSTYMGKIVGWLKATEVDEALYHVLYEDEDEEDLNHGEVSECIALYKTTIATEKLKSKRAAFLESLGTVWLSKQEGAQARSMTADESPNKKRASDLKPPVKQVVSSVNHESHGNSDVRNRRAGQTEPVGCADMSCQDSDTSSVLLDRTRDALICMLRSCASYFADELFLDEVEGQILDCTSAARMGMILEWFGEELTNSRCSEGQKWATSSFDWKSWKRNCLHVSSLEQVQASFIESVQGQPSIRDNQD